MFKIKNLGKMNCEQGTATNGEAAPHHTDYNNAHLKDERQTNGTAWNKNHTSAGVVPNCTEQLPDLGQEPKLSDIASKATATEDSVTADIKNENIVVNEVVKKTKKSEIPSKSQVDVQDTPRVPNVTEKTSSPGPSSSSPSGSTPAIRNRPKRIRKAVERLEYTIGETHKSGMNQKQKNLKDNNYIKFYKNEFLAVRNTSDGFYVCRVLQNVYKTSSKVNIRWLASSSEDESGITYDANTYDKIEADSILTNLQLYKINKQKYQLSQEEILRTKSILEKSLAVERGEDVPSPTDCPEIVLSRETTNKVEIKSNKVKTKIVEGRPKRRREGKDKDGVVAKKGKVEDDDDKSSSVKTLPSTSVKRARK